MLSEFRKRELEKEAYEDILKGNPVPPRTSFNTLEEFEQYRMCRLQWLTSERGVQYHLYWLNTII